MSAPGAVLTGRRLFQGGRSSLASQLVLALLCAGYATGSALGWGSDRLALFMGDFGLSAAAAVAAVSNFAYARCRRSHFRPAWILFAGSSAMASLGNGVWGWYEVVLQRPVPTPSLADLFFLCFAPPAIVGLLVLAKRPFTKAGWVCLALDSWLIAGSLITLSWSLALVHTARFEGQSVTRTALSLAYPLLDIVLVSMVLALHFRRSPGNRTAVNTAIGALALTVMCDALFTSPLLHASYHSGRSSTPAGSPGRCFSRTRPGWGRGAGSATEGPRSRGTRSPVPSPDRSRRSRPIWPPPSARWGFSTTS